MSCTEHTYGMHLNELLLLCLQQGRQLRGYQLWRLASRHVCAEQHTRSRLLQCCKDHARRPGIDCHETLHVAVVRPPAIFCPPDHVCSGRLFHAFRNDMTLRRAWASCGSPCSASSHRPPHDNTIPCLPESHLVPLRVVSYSSPMYTCEPGCALF